MDTIQPEHSKIDDLNKRAWDMRFSNSDDANALSRQALDASTMINYTRGKAEALRTLGISGIQSSGYADALEYLKKSNQLFSGLGDTSEEYFDIIQIVQRLKDMQTQFIRLEKMASLGELTAGIAHEIQNPLNFVNNFSEVNNELIDELKTALSNGNSEQATTIADDIKDNQQKINYHGKRAEAIVKGMLQHSRNPSAQKEPTDINALADEYMRLSYHGLRAKDKSFNATLNTNFDESIGRINIIPQDIGRVLLNLYNNAFYAVSEKQKQNIAGYKPAISVATKKNGDKPDGYQVEIRVKDNGNGIPQKTVDKIFQPFFTTKPTGQGTGLGLSLGYDIIKAHGGEIKVETEENGGSTFIIQLPTK